MCLLYLRPTFLPFNHMVSEPLWSWWRVKKLMSGPRLSGILLFLYLFGKWSNERHLYLVIILQHHIYFGWFFGGTTFHCVSFLIDGILHCTCFHHSSDTASLSNDTPISKTITSLATFPARFHSYDFSTILQRLLVHIIFCAYIFCAHYMYIFYFFLITLFFTKSHTLITLCA